MIISDLNCFRSAELDFLFGASGSTNVKANFDSTSFIFAKVLPSGGILAILKTSSKIDATLTSNEANSHGANIFNDTSASINLNEALVDINHFNNVNFTEKSGGPIIAF